MQSETHTFFFLALPLTSGWVGGMTLGGNFLASSPNNKSTLCLWTFLLQLINYLTCSTMFSVPNIDQMYKEMKKIVEFGNKHGNEFLDFADLFFFLA
jgi:hypothetical protein